MNNAGYRQANAYYGGRYNPSNIYGQGRRGSETISMYNPQAEAQFLQASVRAQERFDKASMASAQALSTIDGMDTYDAPELQSRLKSTQDKINKLVQDKYSGDYGAASNEIVNIIGAERAHPFYKFNKQKLEAAKTYQEDRRRLGANFMAADDPMSVSFEDWREGADFAYTAVNRQDIVNNSAAMFKSMANKLMSDPDFKSTEGGKFLERTLQYGFKGPEEAREFLGTDLGRDMVEDLRESMPALSGLDPNAVNDAILQGSYAGIGQSRFETRADPGYLNAAQQLNYQIALSKLGAEKAPPLFKLKGALPLGKAEDAYKEIIADVRNAMVKDVFKGISIDKEVGSYNDLQTALKKASFKIRDEALKNLPVSGTRIKDTPGQIKAKKEYQALLNAEKKVNKMMEEELKDTENVTVDSKTGKIKIGRFTVPSFELNKLAYADPKGITALNKINTQLNNYISGKALDEQFKGVGGKKDIENVKNISDKFEITDIAFNPFPREGHEIILGVKGLNAAKKPIEAKISTTDITTINNMISFMIEAGAGKDFADILIQLGY